MSNSNVGECLEDLREKIEIFRCGTVVAMMLFLILLFTAFKANDNLRVIQLNEEV